MISNKKNIKKTKKKKEKRKKRLHKSKLWIDFRTRRHAN